MFLVLVLILSGAAAVAHPLKMATGRTDFDRTQHRCTVQLHFFADDFEAAVRMLYPQPAFDYVAPSERTARSVEEYICQRLRIGTASAGLHLSLLRIERADDNLCRVLLTASYRAGQEAEAWHVTNTLLFEAYRKQANVLYVFVGGVQRSILQFYPSSPTKSFVFE